MGANQVQMDYAALISEAWGKLKNNLVIFVLATIIYIAICSTLSQSNIKRFVLFIVIGPLFLGLAQMALRAARDEKVDLGILFSGFKNFVPACLAGILINIFVTIGTVLCIIPGILVSTVYMFTFFYLANGVNNFWDAMESSRNNVMANFLPWLLLLLVAIALNIIGALFLLIGILVTFPLTLILVAISFDRFLVANAEVIPVIDETTADNDS